MPEGEMPPHIEEQFSSNPLEIGNPVPAPDGAPAYDPWGGQDAGGEISEPQKPEKRAKTWFGRLVNRIKVFRHASRLRKLSQDSELVASVGKDPDDFDYKDQSDKEPVDPWAQQDQPPSVTPPTNKSVM